MVGASSRPIKSRVTYFSQSYFYLTCQSICPFYLLLRTASIFGWDYGKYYPIIAYLEAVERFTRRYALMHSRRAEQERKEYRGCKLLAKKNYLEL